MRLLKTKAVAHSLLRCPPPRAARFRTPVKSTARSRKRACSAPSNEKGQLDRERTAWAARSFGARLRDSSRLSISGNEARGAVIHRLHARAANCSLQIHWSRHRVACHALAPALELTPEIPHAADAELPSYTRWIAVRSPAFCVTRRSESRRSRSRQCPNPRYRELDD